jgi:hypothetical protein
VNVSDLETQGELLPKFLKLLLSQEVAHLAAAAKKSGMSEQSDLIDLHRHLVGKAIQLPLRDLEAAKAQVRSEPFNENRLAELRRLEFEAGRAVYVSYLDARLSQIRKETR